MVFKKKMNDQIHIRGQCHFFSRLEATLFEMFKIENPGDR